MKKICRTLSILLIGVATASANTYYISPLGDDVNNGTTTGTAWKSPNKVTQYAWEIGFLAGDILLFEGNNTFTGGLYFQKDKPSIGRNSGSSSNLISLGSYGGGIATLFSGTVSGFYAYNLAGFSIDGLNFIGSGPGVNSNSGIIFYADISQTLSTIVVRNVEVSGYKHGFNIGEYCPSLPYLGYTNIRILGSQFHHNLSTGIFSYGKAKNSHSNFYISLTSAYSNYGDPAVVTNSGSGIVISAFDGALIEYCTAYDNGKDNQAVTGGPVGMWAYEAKNVTFQHCESYQNKSKGFDGGGFDLDGGTENCIIQYCYSHDNYGPGFLFAQYPGASTMQNDVMRYNISVNDGRQGSKGGVYFWGGNPFSNCHFYNNTLYADNTTGMIDGSAGMVVLNGTNYSGIKIRNNIFYVTGGAFLIDAGGSTPATSKIHFQNNLYYAADNHYKYKWRGTTHASLAAWKSAATGQEKDNVRELGYEANPALVSPGQSPTLNNTLLLTSSLSGYKLDPNSIAIDAGINISLPSYGSLSAGNLDFFNNTLPRGDNFDIGAYESDKPKLNYFIDINPDTIFTTFGQTTTPITITSNVGWSVTNTAEWIIPTIDYDYSANYIDIGANDTDLYRTAIITIAGGSIKKMIYIIQDKFIETGILLSSPINKLRIYPNPVDEGGTLLFNKPIDYKIYDLMGYEVMLGKNKSEINLIGIPPGVYLLKSNSNELRKIFVY